MEIRRFILGFNDCLAGNHHTNNASLEQSLTLRYQINRVQVMFVYNWERENCPLYGVAGCQLSMG